MSGWVPMAFGTSSFELGMSVVLCVGHLCARGGEWCAFGVCVAIPSMCRVRHCGIRDE